MNLGLTLSQCAYFREWLRAPGEPKGFVFMQFGFHVALRNV